jgi:hypothetical protein
MLKLWVIHFDIINIKMGDYSGRIKTRSILHNINGAQRVQDLLDFNKLANQSSARGTPANRKLLLPPIQSHRDRSGSNMVSLLEETPIVRDLMTLKLPMSVSTSQANLTLNRGRHAYTEYSIDLDEDMAIDDNRYQAVLGFVGLVLDVRVKEDSKRKHLALEKLKQRKLQMSKKYHMSVKGKSRIIRQTGRNKELQENNFDGRPNRGI